jgi:hypothetical protein
MTIGSIRSTSPTRQSVDVEKFKRLGKIASFEYYTRDGREYAVGRPVNPEEIELRPGEQLVTTKIPVKDGPHTWEDIVHHVAYEVPVGTYAEKAARAERRRKPNQHPARPWDVLAALPAMHRREPMRIALGGEKDPNVARFKTWAKTKPPAVIEVGGHEAAEHTPQGYAEWLASRGVQLSVTKGGRLLPTSAKPLGLDERALIAQAEELLVGYLTGKPVICSLCDATAVSVAFPRVPLCAEHLEGKR